MLSVITSSQSILDKWFSCIMIDAVPQKSLIAKIHQQSQFHSDNFWHECLKSFFLCFLIRAKVAAISAAKLRLNEKPLMDFN